jgi:hypothetical protein
MERKRERIRGGLDDLQVTAATTNVAVLIKKAEKQKTGEWRGEVTRRNSEAFYVTINIIWRSNVRFGKSVHLKNAD